MGYLLRPYQKDASDAGINFYNSKSKKKSIIVAPVATGKSLIIADLANRIKESILVIQPNKELLEQNYAKYISYGNKASIYSASLNQKEIGHVTFATPGSIKNIATKFSNVGLILFDECHLQSNPTGMIGSFIKQLPQAKILGLTATPVLLTSSVENGPFLQVITRSRKSFWNEIIYLLQIQDIYKKFWCPLDYESIEVDDDSLKWNVSKSEYTESSMNEFFEDNDLDDKVIEKLKENTKKKSILIFCPSIESAFNLHSKIEGSELVTSKTSAKERTRITEGFKNHSIRIVVNVLVYSVGFDHPGLDWVIDLSPTASAVRWYQKWGRGCRIDPSNVDKRCLITDYAGMSQKFGKLEDLNYLQDIVHGWGMFSGDTLITGIPISMIGSVRKTGSVALETPIKLNFGRFNGKKITEVPFWYLNWLGTEFTFSPKYKLLQIQVQKLLNP